MNTKNWACVKYCKDECRCTKHTFQIEFIQILYIQFHTYNFFYFFFYISLCCSSNMEKISTMTTFPTNFKIQSITSELWLQYIKQIFISTYIYKTNFGEIYESLTLVTSNFCYKLTSMYWISIHSLVHLYLNT